MSGNSENIIDITNINEKVYQLLKERIVNLTYPPGHRIKNREIIKELKISQTPLKDALMRLSDLLYTILLPRIFEKLKIPELFLRRALSI